MVCVGQEGDGSDRDGSNDPLAVNLTVGKISETCTFSWSCFPYLYFISTTSTCQSTYVIKSHDHFSCTDI